MKTPRPSAALIVALLALVVALSGSAYAVVKSNGDAIIKKSSLSGNRLKANTVKGSQIKESSLKTVPKAEAVVRQPLIALSFGPGWERYTGYTTRATGYRKDASGFVHLQGTVTRSTGSGTLIATLPPGFRPNNFNIAVYTSGDTFGSLYLTNTGEIQLASGNPSAVSLEGISFYPDQ